MASHAAAFHPEWRPAADAASAPFTERAPLNWLAKLQDVGDAAALRAALSQQWPGLANGRPRRLAIVGASDGGRRLARLASEKGVVIDAVVDDDPARLGEEVVGVSVAPIAALMETPRDTPILIAMRHPSDMSARVKALGFDTVAPDWMLQYLNEAAWPLDPRHSESLQDLADNHRRYTLLAEILADDASRQTLDAAICARMTGDVSSLSSLYDPSLFAPADLLSFRSDEVYVDGGASDGDAMARFAERVDGSFERMIGFEPDRQAHSRLTGRFAADARVETVASGLGKFHEVRRFARRRARGLRESVSGEIEAPVTAIDLYFGVERVSYIKLSLSGGACDALRGARATIARWRPKLAVAASHCASDLWEAPLLMLELNPAAEIFLRQHEVGAAKIVAYAVPTASRLAA